MRSEKVLALFVVGWSLISFIGIVLGLKGKITVYRGRAEVVLSVFADVVLAFCVAVQMSAERPGDGAPVGAWVIAACLMVILALSAVRTNGGIARGMLAVVTGLFAVGLVMALALLSIGKFADVAQAKTRDAKLKHAVAGVAAGVGSGLAVVLVRRLVGKRPASSDEKEPAVPRT